MKRGWLIVLLLSLGMNLGLGLNALIGTLPDQGADPAEQQDRVLDIPVDRAGTERFLGRRLERMAARLGLSPEQKEALWEIHLADGRTIVARRRELQQARMALQQLLSESDPGLEEIQAAQHEISVLQASIDSVVVRVMFQERAVLTPEQLPAYRGLFPMTPHGHAGPRGKHGPHTGGRGGREIRPDTP